MKEPFLIDPSSPISPTSSLASVLMVAPLLLAPLHVAAQHTGDSPRERALRDFHGPDLEGKDGPLSTVGLDLLTLYHRYQEAEDKQQFSPNQSGIHVHDGRVVIDAVAVSEVDTLLAELEVLGLDRGATTGRLVSGRFPIENIPDLAHVASLRGVMPSQAQTQRGNQQLDTSLSPSDTAGRPADSGRSDSLPPSSDASEPSVDNETAGQIGFALLLFLLVVVVLFENGEHPIV